MNTDYPTLYVSRNSDASDSVQRVLDNAGVGYRKVVVEAPRGASSGPAEGVSENELPRLAWNENDEVSNLDEDKLVAFLRDHGVEFEDS